MILPKTISKIGQITSRLHPRKKKVQVFLANNKLFLHNFMQKPCSVREREGNLTL